VDPGLSAKVLNLRI